MRCYLCKFKTDLFQAVLQIWLSPSALQKTNGTNTDINKDKQNNVLIIMSLLAVTIKRGSTNVRTPEASAVSFEARPGIMYSVFQCPMCW